MFYSINGKFIEPFDLHLSEYKSGQKDVINEECNKMRSELSTLFEKYNQAKANKDNAELNIVNIKKQLIEAEKRRDLTITNINKSAEEYNKILMKLHYSKCD